MSAADSADTASAEAVAAEAAAAAAAAAADVLLRRVKIMVWTFVLSNFGDNVDSCHNSKTYFSYRATHPVRIFVTVLHQNKAFNFNFGRPK